MDSRKMAAWLGRLVVTAGVAFTLLLGANGVAQAADGAAGSDSNTTMVEPGWG